VGGVGTSGVGTGCQHVHNRQCKLAHLCVCVCFITSIWSPGRMTLIPAMLELAAPPAAVCAYPACLQIASAAADRCCCVLHCSTACRVCRCCVRLQRVWDKKRGGALQGCWWLRPRGPSLWQAGQLLSGQLQPRGLLQRN